MLRHFTSRGKQSKGFKCTFKRRNTCFFCPRSCIGEDSFFLCFFAFCFPFQMGKKQGKDLKQHGIPNISILTCLGHNWHIISCLDGMREHNNKEDRVLWTKTKNRKFTMKSLYMALELGTSISFPWSNIWKSWMHPRVSFFA